MASKCRQRARLSAITGINIIPMDRERILRNHTITIRDGIIEQLGPAAEINLPENVEIIPGEGKYLIPGLIDMHVHIVGKEDLGLFIANGVTTVRNMGENDILGLFPMSLRMREKVRQGKLVGPDIFTVGLIYDGEPPLITNPPLVRSSLSITTPAQAKKAVRVTKERGYDLFKIYDNLSPEVYQAILQAAAAYDLPVVGHLPREVELADALNWGQKTIEHLRGYVKFYKPEYAIPQESLADYAQKTKLAGVWNCPTLTSFKPLVSTEETSIYKQRTEMKYISPFMKKMWKQEIRQLDKLVEKNGLIYPGYNLPLLQNVVAKLYEAGAPILMGTDSNHAYAIPGFSAHDELECLVQAGMSPYDALGSATRLAAECLNVSDRIGVIAPGKRADLIILKDNPLENIQNTRKIEGVMLRGEWHPTSSLQERLEKVAQTRKDRGFLYALWEAVH